MMKFDLATFSIAYFSPGFLSCFFIFLELTKVRSKLWKAWKSLPLYIHTSICLICLAGTVLLSKLALPVAIKKEYEEN